MSVRSKRLWTCLAIAIASLAGASVGKDEAFIGARRNYWAFRKPQRPDVPATGSAWPRTPVDAFILQALAEKKLSPSAPASREKLLRRAYLDVTGLPPTPDEADAFLRDRSAGAYETRIDRLLSSPHYGERMALKWLDVVRYADTNGFEADGERPNAWRYRDYVVRSFNQDKPYDRFVKEQIAGDKLYPGDRDALIALGFLRCGPQHVVGGNQDPEMNRQEILVEMTGSIGSSFLGLTVGCARCHNHKFDPILQADYYRLQAIFAGTEFKDIDISSAAEKSAFEDRNKAYQARLKPINDQIAEIEKPYRAKIREEKLGKLDAARAAALRIPAADRTEEQKLLAKEAEAQTKISWDEVVQVLSAEDKQKRAELRGRMHRIELEKPDPPPAAFAVEDAAKDAAPPTYILKAGDYKQKLEQVDPGFVTVIGPGESGAPKEAAGRRAALANWIASPEHPLTARLMVNRIWQMRMGSGLVKTPNDFGLLGGKPGNRKLLDWLATEFVTHNWSVKAIDRMILLSSTYRQSSANDAARAAIDPENNLYWRMNRRRLDGEILRDSILTVSGLINPRMGGKPVRIPIEPEIYDLIFTEGEPDNLWPLGLDKREQFRRSIYLLNKRTLRLPMLANFDQPDAMTSCPVRPASTHPLQALSLLNSDFMQEQSAALASRLEEQCGARRDCQVALAYKIALARAPRPNETVMARRFFKKGEPLADFCLALLNRNEFVYIP